VVVAEFVKDFGITENVAWHALIVNTGNIEDARKYLKPGKNDKVRVWTPSEDAILLSGDPLALGALASERGHQACIERTEFLEGFAPFADLTLSQ